MSVLFLIAQIQDGRHIILLSDNYLVVETKMYFSAKPTEYRTYLDNQYFIIFSLST